ncbi:hypothetical protein GOODEAATRI_002155 [Goodea atripinnis]|uniref:non-specific serine/threonine protein kinase n=1 Tax=Goodea atripinnis TaxID=208336 RepID=A0ABV0NR54_9TELE
MYIGAKRTANPPHIFAVADMAYQSMVSYNTDQANNRTLQEKILLVNSLVEAFGNACTVINDNSSRFGKYLEMKFTNGGTVVGAQISEYLLEKSRVIHQAMYLHTEHMKLGPDIVSNAFYKEQFDAELGSVYSILAAILNSGDIEFSAVASEHQTDKSNITNISVLENVASLLRIRSDELQEALTSHCVVARGETIVRPNTVEKAVEVRDAMGKALYARLFSWIAFFIVLLTSRENDKGLNIGILDIFGFENFKKNSFEQLCINLANEQIQFYFNQHIFAWEQRFSPSDQDEYLNEEVDARMIEYEDNRSLLDLFLQKPMGLLSLLDEESRFPQATDQTLVEILFLTGHWCLSQSDASNLLFSCPFLLSINLFMSSQYSLMDLLSKMVAGQPHFVRCIKPNNDRHANKFDREKVLVQLRYTGVLETAKIRRQGYSHRILFANFMKRYYILAFHAHEEPAVTPEMCAAILEKAKLENWAMGKTKVFLKYYHVEHLNLMVQQATHRIVLLQACIRGWLGAKRYQRMLREREQSALVLQSEAKEKAKKALKEEEEQVPADETGSNIVNNEEEEAKAAVVLQSNYRGFKERNKFKERKKTMAGTELEIPNEAEAHENEAKDPEDKEKNIANNQEENNEEEDESTFEAEENDDSDNTQVPEDEENTEVGDEPVIQDADAGNLSGQERAPGDEAVNLEEETKAATVIQSNFRGHKERKRLQEEGKVPAKKQRGSSQKKEEEAKPTEAQAEADVSSSYARLEDPDETKAAVVIQSNFRGHKERKRLEEEGKIPKRKKEEPRKGEDGAQTEESVPDNQEDILPVSPEEPDEEKAATVLQSNFRGHRDRKKLKTEKEAQHKAKEQSSISDNTALDVTDVVIERKEEDDLEKERQEEENAAVKIQSNFRGYKDRKNLKANKEASKNEAEQLESFSKEVQWQPEPITKTSQDFAALQQKLNEIIQAHQSNPENNGMFVRGKPINGYAPQIQSAEKRFSRTPRRTQQPKTLNTPEDSTYYTLIHVSSRKGSD